MLFCGSEVISYNVCKLYTSLITNHNIPRQFDSNPIHIYLEFHILKKLADGIYLRTRKLLAQWQFAKLSSLVNSFSFYIFSKSMWPISTRPKKTERVLL